MEYNQERLRLQSYCRWPHSVWNRTLNPRTLAAAGLYFTGKRDRTKCFECGIEMYNWMTGDNPRFMHQRINPFCRFIRNERCGNVPLRTSIVNFPLTPREPPPNPYRAIYEGNGEIHEILTRDSRNSIQMRMTETAPSARVPVQTLRTSGVRSSVIARETLNLFSEEHAPLQSETPKRRETVLESALLCKVCLDKDLQVLFLPCGHIVTCERCATKLDNCCYCRMTIRGKQEIFIP